MEPVADGVRADGLAMCAIARKGPTKLPVTSTANTITAAATATNSCRGPQDRTTQGMPPGRAHAVPRLPLGPRAGQRLKQHGRPRPPSLA